MRVASVNLQRVFLGLGLALLLTSAPLLAQGVVSLPTSAATEVPAEFTNVRAVRELSDGRLLVADWREYRLLVLDWARGTHRAILRSGDGPGEFRSLSALVALSGDTTLVVDGTARRLLTLHRDRFVGSVPIEQALHLTQFFSLINGADTAGGLLALAAIPNASDRQRAVYTRMPNFADSLLAVRLHRTGRRIDTVAALRGRPWGRGEFERGEGGRRLGYFVGNPLAVGEQAWLFADGVVAILRKEPYRVDWVTPDGKVRRGAPIEGPEAAVTAADRRFALDTRFREIPPPRLREEEFTGWPALLPAFTPEALLPLPDGRLAVERAITLQRAVPRVDVIDRTGARVATLQLAVGERVVGFGREFVYVVRRDEDDVEYLGRRSWPRR